MSEPVTPDANGTMRFDDGSELRLTERDRPPRHHACDCDPLLERTCRICGSPHHFEPMHEVDSTERGMKDAWDEKPDWEKEMLLVDAADHTKPKPMRIRVLTLPTEIHANQPPSKPFVIIIDRITHNETLVSEAIKHQTGARGVLIFEEEVEIGDSQ